MCILDLHICCCLVWIGSGKVDWLLVFFYLLCSKYKMVCFSSWWLCLVQLLIENCCLRLYIYIYIFFLVFCVWSSSFSMDMDIAGHRLSRHIDVTLLHLLKRLGFFFLLLLVQFTDMILRCSIEEWLWSFVY
jgi:hypothetical protein